MGINKIVPVIVIVSQEEQESKHKLLLFNRADFASMHLILIEMQSSGIEVQYP